MFNASPYPGRIIFLIVEWTNTKEAVHSKGNISLIVCMCFTRYKKQGAQHVGMQRQSVMEGSDFHFKDLQCFANVKVGQEPDSLLKT